MTPILRRIAWFLLLGIASVGRAEEHALIAIMGAYAPEIAALHKEFGVSANPKAFTTSYVNGVRFDRGIVDGKEVIIFQAGWSLVNAAFELQMALDHFPITKVLFAGVAGGTDPAFNIGDVVIPEKWSYHSEAAYLNEDGKGGYIIPDYLEPRRPNYGMIFPHEASAIREGEKDYKSMDSFPADEALLAIARSVVPKLPEMKKAGRPVKVQVGGTGVSGPVFLDNANYRKWVFSVWQAVCTDMESTAYAQVCWANHKPILIVRGLSDLAGGQHGKNPIDENELGVSEIAARVLHQILKEM